MCVVSCNLYHAFYQLCINTYCKFGLDNFYVLMKNIKKKHLNLKNLGLAKTGLYGFIIYHEKYLLSIF